MIQDGCEEKWLSGWMRTRRGVKHRGDELLVCDSLMDEDLGQSRRTGGKQKIFNVHRGSSHKREGVRLKVQ